MHELSMQDGNAEAIYTGQQQDVWHRLGNYMGDDIISIDKLRSVVGIPVEKIPLTYEVTTADGDTFPRTSTKAFLTIRTDTNEELASVGPDYTVVPHDVALVECITPIIDAGYATINAAGLLRQGLGGWTLLRWNLDKMDAIVQDVYRNEIKAYGLCLSYHGEGNANSYANVDVRAVCANTIRAGMANAALTTRVRHTKNANVRQVEAAKQTFKHIVAHHVEMATAYQALKGFQLDRAMWMALVANVAVPDPRKAPDWNKDAPRADLVVDRYKTKVQRLHTLWSQGTGHSGDASAWEAYNGVVESLDHDTDLWKVRSAEGRALELTSGRLGKIRDNVFNSLVAAA